MGGWGEKVTGRCRRGCAGAGPLVASSVADLVYLGLGVAPDVVSQKMQDPHRPPQECTFRAVVGEIWQTEGLRGFFKVFTPPPLPPSSIAYMHLLIQTTHLTTSLQPDLYLSMHTMQTRRTQAPTSPVIVVYGRSVLDRGVPDIRHYPALPGIPFPLTFSQPGTAVRQKGN